MDISLENFSKAMNERNKKCGRRFLWSCSVSVEPLINQKLRDGYRDISNYLDEEWRHC